MLVGVLMSYLRDIYRFGTPFYRCTDETEGTRIYIAYSGSREELDTALLSMGADLQTYDQLPRKSDYDVTESMSPCPAEGECYYLVDDTNLSQALTNYCVASTSTVLVSISNTAEESISQSLNYFTVAEISGFACAFLIFICFFLLTLWPTLAVKEPIMLPKGETD